VTDTMPEQALRALIERLGIAIQEMEHPAVFTVAESEAIHASLPGIHTKNLFLKDDGGAFWLVTAPADVAIGLKALRFTIGSKRLSFGKPEPMAELLGVAPGSVTPVAVINDHTRQVTLVLDTTLTGAEPVNVHPLRNTATIGLAGSDLVRLLTELGHTPKVVTLG